ncbi:LPXTG cell wall anchor domain-containing protein [Streptomyces aurantiogriseus]|uniref:Gram-positive cocci surface proteins LPxTG domain-containing protein n=1 Tax=Streptomyces aurantiogriseus TaxID=66870 RepID=A0A918CLB3_9ACTN|nr:LPXTG cell wall anchor domain-containing protein [Streptomyces aurantiogriseus]GGR29188.1 hypothetical protein GCM10010251_51770 [Streptomyces aurantiogriseus]
MRALIRPPRRLRLVVRLAAALGLAGTLTLTGLPGVGVDSASAATTIKGQRCDQKWLKKKYDSTPSTSGFPAGTDLYEQWRGNPKNYNFPLQGKAFDGLKPPTRAEAEKARSKSVEQWKKQAAASGEPADKAMEIYARFLSTGRPVSEFNNWFDKIFIRNEINNHKGSAFEQRVVKDFNLIGPDWLCEVTVEVRDENGKLLARRKYDAYNQRIKEFNEFKSNGTHRADQLAADRIIARQPETKDHTFRLVGGKKVPPNTLAKLREFNAELERERGKPNQVRIFERQYNGIPQTKPIRGYSRYDTWFSPDPNQGTRGPANDRIRDSAPTPEDARRQQGAARNIDTRGTLPRGGPGGIDFSTLELRYVGDPVKGKGMTYSMKADHVPDPDTNPGWGGEAKMTLASDSFFTWLALTPDKFWVNLNPDEPDRIMDDTFASTDAGRILLEADLQMKHDFYKAMDPKTDLGKQYWAALPKENGYPCMPGLRNWIEPKPAKVREQDGGIYILDAPLALKSTAQTTVTPGPGEPICTPDEAETKAAQAVIDRMIVPAVEKTINTAPQYADLRRVYTSRVAAEWIRQQDTRKETDFRPIINSNKVDRWPLRAPNQNWDKNELFQKYRKIYTEGEFQYEIPANGTTQIYIVGGVDFSKSPKQNISRTQFNVENPTLDQTTKTSMKADDTSYRDTDTAYLGAGVGGTNDTGGGGGDPSPAPTPTPSKPGDDDPTTPAPEPSASGGGGQGKPTPPAHGPDGNLADTGSDTPVGLIAGLAAALAAVGGALVWWLRRRRAATG